MSKQLIDGGGWFDPKKASSWEEDTWWDGHNHVSKAVGERFGHQQLYRTAKGAWILHSWSQWQGSRESWERIEEADACAWLIAQGEHDAAEKYFPGKLSEQEV